MCVYVNELPIYETSVFLNGLVIKSYRSLASDKEVCCHCEIFQPSEYKIIHLRAMNLLSSNVRCTVKKKSLLRKAKLQEIFNGFGSSCSLW